MVRGFRPLTQIRTRRMNSTAELICTPTQCTSASLTVMATGRRTETLAPKHLRRFSVHFNPLEKTTSSLSCESAFNWHWLADVNKRSAPRFCSDTRGISKRSTVAKRGPIASTLENSSSCCDVARHCRINFRRRGLFQSLFLSVGTPRYSGPAATSLHTFPPPFTHCHTSGTSNAIDQMGDACQPEQQSANDRGLTRFVWRRHRHTTNSNSWYSSEPPIAGPTTANHATTGLTSSEGKPPPF